LTISGCSIEPMVAVVAEFEPEMAAKSPQAPRAAIDSPPRIHPRQA
jgi:hypothetical protein